MHTEVWKCLRAGVRPGLQILRVCLWWTGRFDSDTLPPKPFPMSPRKPRTLKPFRAAKEVKRQARLRVGSPPPLQRHETRKRKPPKHRKREAGLETDAC